MKEREDSKKPEELFEEAIENFTLADDAWADIHSSYTEDYSFAEGDQWDDAQLKARKVNNRSALVFNKLKPIVNQIVTNIRQNTPAIKIHPISDNADKKIAQIFDGVIKCIEYNSSAKIVYSMALESAVMGGFGAFRVVLEEDEDGDGKPEIRLELIDDPTTLYIDPAAKKYNYSDAEWAFLIKYITKDEFEKLYPGKESSTLHEDTKNWFIDDMVQIAEYWVKNKDTGYFEQHIMNGNEILESFTEYKGKKLPFIFVTGNRKMVDGKKVYKGVVPDVRDSQKYYNYCKTEIADFLAKTAKTQWLVEADMIGDYQDIWNNQNIGSFNYLPYRSKNGMKPDQVPPAIPPSGLIQSASETGAEIRDILGIKDTTEDIPASASGKAIALQISESKVGSSIYIQNLEDAIKYLGEVLVDLIPAYMSYPHIRTIMGMDGSLSTIPLNQPYQDPLTGAWKNIELGGGKYAVTISTGPSYDSLKSETNDLMVELVGKYPQLFEIGGDILLKNLDFIGSTELADRFRANMNPNILAASDIEDKDSAFTLLQSQAQQMANQLQQLNEQNQQLQQLLSQAQTAINEKNTDRELDMRKFMLTLEFQEKMKMIDIESKRASESEKYKFEMSKSAIEQHQDLEMEQVKSENDITEMATKIELEKELEIARNTNIDILKIM